MSWAEVEAMAKAEQEAAARAEQKAMARARQEAVARSEQAIVATVGQMAVPMSEHEDGAAAGQEVSASVEPIDADRTGEENTAPSLISCFQTFAAETASYSKKVQENRFALFEKLAAAKSFGNAIRIQAEYVWISYEGSVTYLMKIGDLYRNLVIGRFKRRPLWPFLPFFDRTLSSGGLS